MKVMHIRAADGDGGRAAAPVQRHVVVPQENAGAGGERAKGHVNGYLASRSATASNTDTPLLETPQSISVVTQDQIASQGVQSVTDALRYTPGVSLESSAPTPSSIS
jgi:iron complex outermembrane receptor protein